MICIYPPACTDFTTNGLGRLSPIECTIEERAAGMYELTLTQPIDESLRWAQLQPGCILKAPAPVRETPLYSAPATTGPVTVERRIWQVERTTHGAYLRSGPGMNYSRLAVLKNGETLIELEDCEDPWIKVCMVRGGAVGYMSTKWLGVKSVETEIISPGAPTGGLVELTASRDQLFRIYAIEQDSAAATVTARAMHIFYDASGALIDGALSVQNQACPSVIAGMERLLTPCPIAFSSLNVTSPITGDFSYKSPVEALLDPQGGIIAQTGALLVRDNTTATLIPDDVRDRHVTIRRGKNLLGVQVEMDAAGICTRILPVGRDANGNPLTLEERYVDSPRPHDQIRIRRVEYDVQVGKDGIANATQARQELRRLAAEEFTLRGADLPTCGMEVDFVLLAKQGAEADKYASLQAVHLYDTVTVIDESIGLRAKLKVTGYTFDCLTGQYRSMTLGKLTSLEQTVYAYALPDESLSGTKIIPGTLSGAALRTASIDYARINSAAVKQLSAEAITALTARINEIVAKKLTTDELYAAYGELITLKAGNITAENLQTDALAAELARITVLCAGSASFDRATIAHLVSRAMNLEFGVAGEVFIRNLSVEYAQMLGAAIGSLCIRAADGSYYSLDVKADGSVHAVPTHVTEGEALSGATSEGLPILETNILAQNLSSTNLLASYALLNQIDAARIDVDTLFAREAFVDLLRTSRIVGDESLTMIASRISKNFRQEELPGPTDNVQPGDTWVIPSLSAMYQAEDATYLNIAFHLDENGNLYYSADTDEEILSCDGYSLLSDLLCMNVTEDGEITAWRRWRAVSDMSSIQASQDALYQKQKELEAGQSLISTYLRIDPEMVRIGKTGVTSEFTIDPWGAGVSINRRVFSRFEADRARFGDMEIRRPAVGGLLFDSV